MGGGGKGGGGSAPQAPDPYESADAQLNANVIAGMITNGMGRNDVNNPYYSVINKSLGDGRWQQNIMLSPEQQFLLDQQNALSANMNAQAGDTLGGMQGMRGYDALTSPVGSGSRSALEQALAANLNPGPMDTRRYEDAVYSNFASRLDPEWKTTQGNLENQLANQGISRGSAAWNTSMDQMGRSRNDAYGQARNAAVGAGLQAQNQFFGQGLQARNQGLMAQNQFFGQDMQNRNLGLQGRGQALNELLALSGRGQPQTASAPQSGSPNIQAPDIQGAMQNQYNAEMQQWQQSQNNAQNTMSGLFSLGAAGLGGWLSDRRLKHDIRRIGETEGGVPLYEFRYRAGGPLQIGVMAQDVEQIVPAAVVEIGGIKHVDYRLVA